MRGIIFVAACASTGAAFGVWKNHRAPMLGVRIYEPDICSFLP